MARPAGFLAVILVSALTLDGCAVPVGFIADPIIKGHQGQDAGEIEHKIQTKFMTNPALSKVKVSVARSNNLTDLYSTRYSVLLAGEVTSQNDHDTACNMLPELIGAERDTIQIADKIRITSKQFITIMTPDACGPQKSK